MKKFVLALFTLSALLALTGCNTATDQVRTTEPAESISEEPIPFSAVEKTSMVSYSVDNVEDAIKSVEDKQSDDNVVETEAVVEKDYLTDEELHTVYDKAYEVGLVIILGDAIEPTGLNKEEAQVQAIPQIVDEIYSLKDLPENYVDEYYVWRLNNHKEYYFTPCDETVYATSTVNARKEWSLESEKLGQLSKSESIHRVGIGKDDEGTTGWSLVEFNGVYACMKSDYLSKTKPTTKSSTSSNKSSTSNSSSSNSSSSNSGTSNSSSNSNNSNPYGAESVYIDEHGATHYVGKNGNGLVDRNIDWSNISHGTRSFGLH